jgi:starch synthase
MPIRICFVSSEVAPLAKTGGLADVSGALPRQLHAFGHDVRVFMPLYAKINRTNLQLSTVEGLHNLPLWLGTAEFRFSVLETQLPGSTLPIYLIDCPAAFDRPTLYTTGADEHLRFLILQRATFEACRTLKFAPQILQCNDWHTALMPLMLKTQYSQDALFAKTRTLLSIHNIGYQGHFSSTTIAQSGLGDHATWLDATDLAHGLFNWLKEGVRHADRVATVSPTYAQEIAAPIGGHGLDTALRARGDAVAGILNGVDYHDWNPAVDTLLPAHYSPENLSGKNQVRNALLQRMQLHVADTTPVIGMVSRLTPQKGFDLR